MLTDPKLRSDVDKLWDKLWTGGLSNPLDAIEQLSYLHLPEAARRPRERGRAPGDAPRRDLHAARAGRDALGPLDPAQAGKALAYLRDVIFPWFRELGAEGSSFERYMGNAEFKINKPAC